jgi:hypothetical protein
MERTMRNVIRSFAAAILAIAGLGSGARAADAVVATVPFGFQAAGTFLPPGEYRFSVDSNTDLLIISGRNVSAAVLLSAGQSQDHSPRTFLQFQCAGNRWLLSGVSFAGATQPLTSTTTAFNKLSVPQECAGGAASPAHTRSLETLVPQKQKEN